MNESKKVEQLDWRRHNCISVYFKSSGHILHKLYKVFISPARALNYEDSQRKWEKEPFLWKDTILNLEKARPLRPEICTFGFTTMSTWHLRILYLTTTKCSCLRLKIWQLQISHCFFVDRTIMKNSKKVQKKTLFSTTGPLEVATDWPTRSYWPKFLKPIVCNIFEALLRAFKTTQKYMLTYMQLCKQWKQLWAT